MLFSMPVSKCFTFNTVEYGRMYLLNISNNGFVQISTFLLEYQLLFLDFKC